METAITDIRASELSEGDTTPDRRSLPGLNNWIADVTADDVSVTHLAADSRSADTWPMRSRWRRRTTQMRGDGRGRQLAGDAGRRERLRPQPRRDRPLRR